LERYCGNPGFVKWLEDFASYFGFGFLGFDGRFFNRPPKAALFHELLYAEDRGFGARAAVADLPAAGRCVVAKLCNHVCEFRKSLCHAVTAAVCCCRVA
jgi:hypothetical protein